MSPVGGVQQPKNQEFANIVEQERERIRMRQDPANLTATQKAKVIWIVGVLALVALSALLIVLFLNR